MNSNWSYSPETPNLGQNRRFFVPCNLQIWQMTLKNNRAPLLCCLKLCASFHSHHWIQTGLKKSPETPTVGQKRRFLEPCDLEIWRMTLKNIRAPLLSNIKLCTSFHHHMWIDPSHRCGHPQAACREPTGSYDKTTRAAICFEHKTQYLWIRAPYNRIVVFWHISNIPPMISQSQISCNTPTFICLNIKCNIF